MNILFVCTGNTCRSPMAEAIARDVFLKNNIDASIRSRGLSVISSSGASKYAIEAVSNLGLSLEGFRAMAISIEDIKWADVIIAMTKGHKDALKRACEELNKELYTLIELSDNKIEDIVDPFGGSLLDYIECSNMIKQALEKIAIRIKEGK